MDEGEQVKEQNKRPRSNTVASKKKKEEIELEELQEEVIDLNKYIQAHYRMGIEPDDIMLKMNEETIK